MAVLGHSMVTVTRREVRVRLCARCGGVLLGHFHVQLDLWIVRMSRVVTGLLKRGELDLFFIQIGLWQL